MTDVAFEARLERVARRYAETAVRPVDAAEIAAFAMRVGDRPVPRLRLVIQRRSWFALVVAGSVLAASAGLALLAGGGQPPTTPPSSSPTTSPTPSPELTPAPIPVTGSQTQSGTWLADLPSNTT